MVRFELASHNLARKRNQLLPHSTKRYSKANRLPLISPTLSR